MEHERGRKISQGAQHISPVPSPHRYSDATTGIDPSSTFTTDSYAAEQQSFNFAHPQDSRNFINDYPIPQMGNSYMNNMDPGFNNDYILPSNQFTDTFNSQFPMNSFEADQNNVNPADLSKISSPENHSPRLLSPEHHLQSGPQSPASTNGQFHTPQHSRNTSLDPNSAYHTVDWTYRHQRSPSDVSERSSVHNSPFLPQADIEGHPSPLIAGQDSNTFGFDAININESHSQPGSTYHSPRLMPVQDGLGIDQNSVLASQYSTGQELYQDDVYQLHNRNQSVASDMGQADQFVPPTINIEPAPVSRQASFGPNGEIMGDALSPTGSGRGRVRAQSDVTFSRPMTARSVSPARSNRDSLSVRSPSPGPASRSSSPGVSDGRISKDRRASTSAINSNNREYILDLADPNRPNGGQSGGSTRVQKHPATFQCTLCPKRFTRAYNLRSHLRTHTDERPFVCTVCGKAFARQHDRKRHEGLHSGEKKFVCKGELNSNPGQPWGCGRRFARADALGRHFRSEAGRVCIKPLLEEEAAERRQKAMMEQAQQQAMLQPVPQPIMADPTTGFALPAALMMQYPQLATINWAAMQTQADDDPGELSDIGIGGGYDDGLDAGVISDSGTYGHTSVW